MLVEIPTQGCRRAEHLVTEGGWLINHLALVIFIMVIAVFVIMLVFMIFLVIVFMMHFGDETIAFDMIKPHTQIQRGEAKVIRAKKAERCLSRIDRGHKGLFTDDRNFFFGVVQHYSADPLTRTQIQ